MRHAMSKRLVDPFNRTISYLRMSITDRCNFNCFYCRPDNNFNRLLHDDILTYDELFRLATIAVSLGVKKVRLTGGEPLVRKGIFDFIPRITSIAGLEDVSLTTNGAFLKDNLEKLYAGGIRRLNISLDTLRRDRFAKITGRDYFDRVWKTIERAAEMNFNPIKINMVVIKGVNDDEVLDMAALSLSHAYHIRFIEYMPLGAKTGQARSRTISNSEIRSRLNMIGELMPVLRNPLDGPAKRYKFAGAPGEIGFISSISNHFCKTCNRIRLTANGELRPCLLYNMQEDIKTPLRSGATDEELRSIFRRAVNNKPAEHLLVSSKKMSLSGQMHMIGG
ncbi:GTP 3',8-cyclase MoaA [Desulfosarcina ovata]|uniref:GTP 3',8-cyclase MoaA n=1 Tax=Desulfosarcina ovata TaxID=83564 RepID=UPI0018D94916